MFFPVYSTKMTVAQGARHRAHASISSSASQSPRSRGFFAELLAGSGPPDCRLQRIRALSEPPRSEVAATTRGR